MAYVPRSQGEILSNLKGSVIGRTKVDDINVGSTLYNLLNAYAGEIASIERRLFTIREQFFLNGAEGQDLDSRVEELPPLGLTRMPATNASGSVLEITRSSSVGDLSIPSGSSVKASDGTLYVTTIENIIPNGSLTLQNVHIVCTSSGIAGNKVSGDIAVIEEMPDPVSSVRNTAPLSNGQDLETDVELRKRAYTHLKSLSRCQNNAIESMATSFIGSSGDRFTYARIFEDPFNLGYSELIVDDGTGIDISSVSRPGETVSGIIPSAGSYFIYHEAPATTSISISQISIFDSLNSPVTIQASDYVSIPERGIIHFKEGFLPAGGIWSVKNYSVFTGLIKEVQEEIEGDIDNPSKLTGFRAVGTRIRVLPVESSSLFNKLYISLTITIDNDIRIVERNVISACISFVNTLSPGETLYISALIEVIRGIEGIRDVKVYSDSLYTQLADNITPENARKVIRATSESFTIVSHAVGV